MAYRKFGERERGSKKERVLMSERLRDRKRASEIENERMSEKE